MRIAHSRRVLLAAACLFMAACAPMHHKALSPEAKSRIRDVHVQVVVPQETFIFSATAPGVSAAMGGGLIPALIDASIQKSRQEEMRAQVQPVLDQLLDADFRAEARGALPHATRGLPLSVSRAEVVALMPTRKEHDALLAATQPHEAYLRVLMHYSIDIATRTLVTRSEVSLWQKGETRPVFAGSAIYHGTPLGEGDAVTNMRLQMRDAVASTVKLAALDIEKPASQGNVPRQPFVIKTAGQPVTVQGELLGDESRRAFFRSPEGAMFSVQR